MKWRWVRRRVPPIFAVPPLPNYSPVFIDAPHVLNPVDPTTDVERVNEDGLGRLVDPMLTPRGWWTKADSGKAESYATGLEASLEYLRDYLAHENFDVCSWGPSFCECPLTSVERPSSVSGVQLCFVAAFVFSEIPYSVRERRLPSSFLSWSVPNPPRRVYY